MSCHSHSTSSYSTVYVDPTVVGMTRGRAVSVTGKLTRIERNALYPGDVSDDYRYRRTHDYRYTVAITKTNRMITHTWYTDKDIAIAMLSTRAACDHQIHVTSVSQSAHKVQAAHRNWSRGASYLCQPSADHRLAGSQHIVVRGFCNGGRELGGVLRARRPVVPMPPC